MHVISYVSNSLGISPKQRNSVGSVKITYEFDKVIELFESFLWLATWFSSFTLEFPKSKYFGNEIDMKNEWK
jgi:hypothetical protein